MQDALHPTPAVCGRPQAAATAFLQRREPFDRGLYSGPFGLLSANTSEFVVGIRSALVTPAPAPRALLYAGVGIVAGSDAAEEWRELELKVAPFRRALPPPQPARRAPNDNAAWAQLLVDELVRNGVAAFAVAPGSRSSPLTHAAFQHPAAAVTVCLDERSLGFWAVGHARATAAPVAVVTTSGTAVANLFPAVVEASMSAVPLVVLSADRPGEVRATGANQTIDQVNIFGSYVRHAADLQPPGPHVSGAVALTAAAAAVRHAVAAGDPGPVQLNCQFREPLAPIATSLSPHLTAGLAAWEASGQPYTRHVDTAAGGAAPALTAVVATLRRAACGVVVAGQLDSSADRLAARAIAAALGWPIVADVLSGLRVRSASPLVIHHLDTLLATPVGAPDQTAELRPDCILQVGAPLVSKRISQFLRSAARPADGGAAAPWLLVSRRAARRDEHHCVSAHLTLPPAALAAALRSCGCRGGAASSAYAARLAAADHAAAARLHDAVLRPVDTSVVTEPAVAMTVAAHLPAEHGLFVGSSMPIRDLDMYGTFRGGLSGLSNPVSANRGASGIDGVVSTAAGFAAGLQRPATLLVGDLSFLHDTNGLLLLNEQAAGAALTVVLINNGGGGIFHFLPIHDAIDEGVARSLCFATSVVTQLLTDIDGVRTRAAWALGM